MTTNRLKISCFPSYYSQNNFVFFNLISEYGARRFKMVDCSSNTCCLKHWNDKFQFVSHKMSLQLCLHYSSCLDLISKRWELSPPGIFWLVHGAWLHAYSPDILLVDCACGKSVFRGKGKQKVIYPLHNQ